MFELFLIYNQFKTHNVFISTTNEMDFNNRNNNDWTLNNDHMNTTQSSNAPNVGPKKIIRNLALKRIKEVIPLENKVKNQLNFNLIYVNLIGFQNSFVNEFYRFNYF